MDPELEEFAVEAVGWGGGVDEGGGGGFELDVGGGVCGGAFGEEVPD